MIVAVPDERASCRINTGLVLIDGRMQMFPSQSYSILIHPRPIDGSIRLF